MGSHLSKEAKSPAASALEARVKEVVERSIKEAHESGDHAIGPRVVKYFTELLFEVREESLEEVAKAVNGLVMHLHHGSAPIKKSRDNWEEWNHAVYECSKRIRAIKERQP